MSAIRRVLLGLVLALSAVPLHGQDRPDPTYEVLQWQGQDVVAGRLVVGFQPGTPMAIQHVRHQVLGARALAQLSADLAVIELPRTLSLEAGRAAYAARPEVAFVEPDVLHGRADTPNDTKWGQQWGLVRVEAESAWSLAKGDADTIVAVIDSGCRTDHADLDDHYAFGWDAYAEDDVPEDLDGHGTHCAGVAAAETHNAQGVAGASWHGRFAAYRAGNGTFPTSALVKAIQRAVADGCQVLSMSWGSSYNSLAIRNALMDARDAGCVLVAAAGNDNTTTKFYPAALPYVIAVASSAPNDTRSSFSNHGSWVDVAAPGQSIYSTWMNGGYSYLSGTSMACPMVAGLASLLYAELGGTRTEQNAAAVREAILTGTVPVGGWVAHGRIDFAAALDALDLGQPAAPWSLLPASVAALDGGTVTVAGTGFLGVTDVLVDDVAAEDVIVHSDTSLSFAAPWGTSLGAHAVRLVEGSQQSASVPLVYTETDPPQLLVEYTVPAGGSLAWHVGGRAGHGALLLISLAPQTFSFKGSPLLLDFAVLLSAPLDAAGRLDVPVTLPPNLGPLTFYTQAVTLHGGFTGATPVRETNILP